MASSVTIREEQVLIALDSLGKAVADLPDMLRIVGAYMLGSVAKTFRDEGSPAGSWPELAASTKKRKGYTAGHKLLIMSGRLFGSITAAVDGNLVRIGTGVAYARVQFQGSSDRQGSQAGGGPKTNDNHVVVSAYAYHRVKPFRQFGRHQQINEFGDSETVRKRYAGPANAATVNVSTHQRHQNIPARNALVFRPEDPSNIATAIDGYIAAKLAGAK